MASATQDLDQFVRDALLRGCSRQGIEQALLDAGWAPEQVSGALAAYADVVFAVPVPRPRAYLSAREAFFYLVLFTTLYLSAYHLGSLLFELIDRHFPDPTMLVDLSHVVHCRGGAADRPDHPGGQPARRRGDDARDVEDRRGRRDRQRYFRLLPARPAPR